MAEPTGPKAALVTGAAKRIGGAIARDLARHGWAVAVHYHHSAADAAALVREIEQAGGRAVALPADLAREAHTHALIARAVEALGPLTCLVNNASLFEMDKIETVTRASWDAHIETDLRAPLVLSQDFAGQLPAGSQGNIVNMLDQRVWNLTPYFLSYTVAKMGLWTLTRTLALALAPRIRVNGIGPGPTLPSPRQSPEQFAEQCRATPLGRATTLEEICAAVQFILGAPAVTGQMIALDAGQHLGWAQPSRGYVARE
ncbi:MAG TPA: SDR family oxidoreductase [Candidatus Angelobacter sp.]|nr:SDR family oxidoreductase [Candidatus Angelobacter sp.]